MKIKVRSKLGELLDERMVNKSELARSINATPKQLYAWCSNKEDGQAKSTPSVGYLLRLKKVLGVDIEDMFEEINEK
ncbi:helix-turn-helix transcriptional regulator [Desertibacillus haloalkaliphilus]|uniref:helix-turn-helix transcriptional regulator n=1 Tax=Desertibacillus haloalkaliphilus TaxID=1328930 RepID=UPI001C2591FF|nr:helix-turn-helix transcriptional regulator [Desertibacillus haloalkaliphilus]